MKKLLMIIISATLIFYPSLCFAKGNSSIDEVLKAELEKIDLSDLEKLNENNNEIYKKPVSEMVLEMASGKSEINVQSVLEYLFDTLLIGVKDGILGLSFIILTVIVCGLLKNMAAEGMGNISAVCEQIGFILIVSTLLSTFFAYVSITKEMLYLMQSFIRIVFPPLITLMVAMGGFSSAGVFRPAMAVMSGGMIEFIGGSVLPVAIIGGVTGIMGGIGGRLKPEKISEVCNTACKWLMGIAFTVYAGVISVQGVMAASYDGIYVRTAKYTVDSFMPVVGGMMSDTVDAVLGCSLLLKNAIGFTGLIIICSICLLPLIKFVICIFSYKLLGSVIETVFETKTVKAIKGLTGGITTMFVICCVVTLMTFITVGLAIGAGNMNVMLR